MTDIEILELVRSAIMDFGISVLLAYLYIAEKKAHNETIRHRIEDLREQAGYKSNSPRLDTKATK